MQGLIYLADGTVYRGIGFGAKTTAVGELVFNTSMTGYQSIMTDPSYKGQIINMTYPLVGNYGISDVDYQSDKIHAFGMVIRDLSIRPSNRMCIMTLSDWLEKMGVPGVHSVDSRAITKKIRVNGTIKAVISTEEISLAEAKKLLDETELRTDWMQEVSIKKIKHFNPSANENEGTNLSSSGDLEPGMGKKIAILDLGIKTGILDKLLERGLDITMYPYGTTAREILDGKFDGVFISNGPGDPEAATATIETVRALVAYNKEVVNMSTERSGSGSVNLRSSKTLDLKKPLPIFGICMGHQILSLAQGAKTYKLKFGHRGANHGVLDKDLSKSNITSQNHSYAVDPETVNEEELVITHINLNDNTVEGIRHRSLPMFSVQYHPEGSPGPNDNEYLFDNFIKLMN